MRCFKFDVIEEYVFSEVDIYLETSNKPAPEMGIGYTKECSMYYLDKNTPEYSQRSYLLGQLYDLQTTKTDELLKKFNILPEYPKTPKQVIDYIKEGKYTFDENRFNCFMEEEGLDPTSDPVPEYRSLLSFITWGDKTPDKAGYAAASAKLDVAFKTAKDAIVVLPLDEALKAKRTFEQA